MPKDLALLFGKDLRRHRMDGGLTQRELANAASLDRTAISLLERGMRVPTIDTVARLAAALGIPVAELFRSIESSPARTLLEEFVYDA